MVLLDRQNFVEAYTDIRRAAAETGGCSVLIFVSPACDAIAACRLLSVRVLPRPSPRCFPLTTLIVSICCGGTPARAPASLLPAGVAVV